MAFWEMTGSNQQNFPTQRTLKAAGLRPGKISFRGFATLHLEMKQFVLHVCVLSMHPALAPMLSSGKMRVELSRLLNMCSHMSDTHQSALKTAYADKFLSICKTEQRSTSEFVSQASADKVEGKQESSTAYPRCTSQPGRKCKINVNEGVSRLISPNLIGLSRRAHRFTSLSTDKRAG